MVNLVLLLTAILAQVAKSMKAKATAL